MSSVITDEKSNHAPSNIPKTPELLEYPLPVSNNQRLVGLTLKRGRFNECIIQWSGSFMKDDAEIQPKHVFILSDVSGNFFHVYWKSSGIYPVLLTEEHWDKCFDIDKAIAISNRYLFKLNDKVFYLPYLPSELHSRQLNLHTYRRNDEWVATLYKKWFAEFQNITTPRRKIKRFVGWVYEHKQSPSHNYRRVFLNTKEKRVVLPFDVRRDYEELTEEQKKMIRNSFSVVKILFPNLILN